MNLDWKQLSRPIIALSPMADMTDSAFCRTVKSLSSNARNEQEQTFVVFREMVSAEAVTRGNEKTLGMTDIHPEERPLVQQIFGSDPDMMAEAVRIIDAEHSPDGFDVNMGCPVYKIVHNFNGCALMQKPELAAEIIRKMKAVTTKPISVKIRLGWENPSDCISFAKTLEEAGVDMITVHGRTKVQGYSGESDWEMIKQLKEHLSIPVLANGDIFTAPLVLQALNQTTCDGVLIARGALGNPWIFSQTEEMLVGKAPTPISITNRVDVIKHHLALHLEQYGEKSVTTFRKHLTWYLKGLDGAKKYKERLHTAATRELVESILEEMKSDPEMQDAIAHRDGAHPDAGNRIRLTK